MLATATANLLLLAGNFEDETVPHICVKSPPCQMKSVLFLFGMLAFASAGGFFDLPAYNDNGQSESLSRFQGNVTLVVNTAHL